MPNMLAWKSDISGLLRASTGEPLLGARWFLVVEALPDGGWDWLVWINDGSGRCMHGIAVNATAAMSAAEDATQAFQLASLPLQGAPVPQSLN